MALAIIAEGKGACKIAYCRVCLALAPQRTGRGPKRKYCPDCSEYGRQGLRIKLCRACLCQLPPRSGKRWCDACAPARKTEWWDERNAYNKDLRAARRNAVSLVCKECNVTFSPSRNDQRSLFCSMNCQKKNNHRIHDPLRRARARNAKVEQVDPFKVFERDGWRCQLCGNRTPKQLRGTNSENAPQLDHILPLSRGGEHSYRNTQCTCRRCNAAKGAKPYGQIPLIAF